MGFRLTLLALGLLLPLTACSEDAELSPDTQPGDTVAGRVAGIDPGKPVSVLTPAGRIQVAFADPVDHLDEDQTTDLRERNPPEGGAFIPMVWSFKDDVIHGDIARLFGDREPLEVELVADDVPYPLTPPDASPGESVEYIAVEGDGQDLSLDVKYGKVTQTLAVESGRLHKGVAKGLYDLPKTKIKLKNCPIEDWFQEPGVFPQYVCRYATAIDSPYVANTWVKPGHTWLAVTVVTNLALFATSDLSGEIAIYRVVGNTELSTVDGEESLGTLHESVNDGAASGTLVFDIKGELPETLHILRDYKLTLKGSKRKIDAPERRSVQIGGDVALFY